LAWAVINKIDPAPVLNIAAKLTDPPPINSTPPKTPDRIEIPKAVDLSTGWIHRTLKNPPDLLGADPVTGELFGPERLIETCARENAAVHALTQQILQKRLDNLYAGNKPKRLGDDSAEIFQTCYDRVIKMMPVSSSIPESEITQAAIDLFTFTYAAVNNLNLATARAIDDFDLQVNPTIRPLLNKTWNWNFANQFSGVFPRKVTNNVDANDKILRWDGFVDRKGAHEPYHMLFTRLRLQAIKYNHPEIARIPKIFNDRLNFISNLYQRVRAESFLTGIVWEFHEDIMAQHQIATKNKTPFVLPKTSDDWVEASIRWLGLNTDLANWFSDLVKDDRANWNYRIRTGTMSWDTINDAKANGLGAKTAIAFDQVQSHDDFLHYCRAVLNSDAINAAPEETPLERFLIDHTYPGIRLPLTW
jgi:hypothetical protein